MIGAEEYSKIAAVLPFFRDLDQNFVKEFKNTVSLVKIPAGKDVFLEGDAVEAIAFLVSGSVRVYKIGETGREITLYRFGNGSSCILTANAILSRNTFPAIATVEQDAEAVMVPAAAFRDWIRRYDPWREFIFDLLSQRLSSLMVVLDEVAFQRMDRRVASYLAAQARQENPIHTTHQKIASELGSSREVISRLLEEFVNDGSIRALRGTIEVLDFDQLNSRLFM